MKTSIDCLPCLLRQTLQAVRLCSSSEEMHEQVVRAVSLQIATMKIDTSPPVIAAKVYDTIRQLTGVDDPYKEKKQESNRLARALMPQLREELEGKPPRERLDLAIRFSIAGNIIDYGANADFDILRTLKKSRETVFVIDHGKSFYAAVANLNEESKILYLADNCGEIVFDSLLIEQLFATGAKITVAVKDGPIINDALVSDAYYAGLNNYAEIISNGGRYPGTSLADGSESFLEKYRSADLIIAKGQGNFESLSESDEELYFLLTVKCPAAAKHMQDISGYQGAGLIGKGEFALLYSPAKR
ncbi:DUF89 domain-containing protein [Desulforhopalus sp. IMCC35007]|uniref:damage-control phosphatase ARMT1 family protein n=1 Tax=Desulforhopalus sp. IMCC35007 TaxID=2569543 RepID=UPI0010AEACC6|nr:ARMT1-like domain-containing protein [Desulforhopalus sp. IMCC35007]TKB08026.1 DUF89 family protein [Desulforhopalus sp. IMCC35007]